MKIPTILLTTVLFVAGCTSQATQPCTYALTPGSLVFGLQGGSLTIAIGTGTGCAWEARTGATWVTVDGPSTGTGPGSVRVVAAGNTDAANRETTLSVSQQRVTISQIGSNACVYDVAPVQVAPCMTGPAFNVSVAAGVGCPWTATPDAAWLLVDAGGSGNGSGTISAHVANNYDAPRESVLKVRWPTPSLGQNVRVAQAGCLYSVETSAMTMSASGGDAGFGVLQMAQPYECGGPLQDQCVWAPISAVPWITIVSSPGAGDGRVTFRVAPNLSASPRSGAIAVVDKSVTVTQAGAAHGVR